MTIPAYECPHSTTSRSPSHLSTLTTSVTCVLTLMPARSRWLRSPRPVSVGVNTLWPCFSSRSATRRVMRTVGGSVLVELLACLLVAGTWAGAVIAG